MMITKRVDPSILNKKICFPDVRAIPAPKVKTIFEKIKKFLTYRRQWLVREDYVVWSETLKCYIFVPKRFIFDGASVPKFLHSILGPTGVLLLGACPHDEGYCYGGFILADPKFGTLTFINIPKLTMDKVFQELCSKENSLGIVTTLAKLTLTVFGNIAWERCRKENRSLIEDFPELYEMEVAV